MTEAETPAATGEGGSVLPALDHAHYLRLAFAVARQAKESGQHLFGAILVGPDGAVLMEQMNAYLPERDMTGHAERVLATRAGIAYGPRFPPGRRCTRLASPARCARGRATGPASAASSSA